MALDQLVSVDGPVNTCEQNVTSASSNQKKCNVHQRNQLICFTKQLNVQSFYTYSEHNHHHCDLLTTPRKALLCLVSLFAK